MSMSKPSTLHTKPPQRTAWQLALRTAFRSLNELLRELEIEPQAIGGFQPTASEFPILVPRGFAARMRKKDPNDPLLRQVLPDLRERIEVPGFGPDPLQESAFARDGLLQKYAGRVLLISTAACPVHCRYCFRRHFPYEQQRASTQDWASTLRSIEQTPTAREVILSGGDPLSLTNRRLERLVVGLERLENVTTLRIHSRFPVILPERIDQGLLRILTSTRLKTVLVIHANHANEISAAVVDTLRGLAVTGTILLNQSVLLRGINDDPATLEALSHRLFDAGVLPYYLHLLDPVAGAAHYQVDAPRGCALLADLRKRLPGYLVPALVRDVPGGASKTHIA